MMTPTLKLNLRGFSIIDLDDVLPENWKQMNTAKITHSAGNIFSQFLSAIGTFFGNLISSFNDILPPPETRDEWLQVAAHYLIAAVVLILCICCFNYIFLCLIFILRCLFTCISSTVVFLFRGISSIITGCFSGICTIFRFLMPCLRWGGTSAVTMMKAPGMAGVMIARAVFEANPQAYFAGLRSLSR